MLIDYNNKSYTQLKTAVDKLISSSPTADYSERRKGYILADSQPYINFLAKATGSSAAAVRATLLEITDDHEFFALISDGLHELAKCAVQGIRTGEIRIHAHSIYTAVRLLCPEVMIETGVGNGKSSAFILRAMQKNGKGRLYSMDMSDDKPFPLTDGLIAPNHSTGWLVPTELKDRWNLRLGDTQKLLPSLRLEAPSYDLFLHDRFHDYDTMKFELTLAKEWGGDGAVIMCDDIQANDAFIEQSSYMDCSAFGTFGFLRTQVEGS